MALLALEMLHLCCTGAQRADTQLGGDRAAQPRVTPTVPLLCQHCTDSNRQGTHSTSSFYSRGKVSSFSQHLVSIVHFWDWISSGTKPGDSERRIPAHPEALLLRELSREVDAMGVLFRWTLC